MLPSWAEPREYQDDAVEQILKAFNSGDKFVFLDAPTGSGKTLIAYMVGQAMGRRVLYLCSSLSLQDQFVKDFPDAALLKGRSNYPTLDDPELFNSNLHLSCADCTKRLMQFKACLHCSDVHRCPYEMAKAAAYKANVVCTNTAYFLSEANYVGKLINPDRPTLVVIDEADVLEKVLGGFIELRITRRAQERYGIREPAKKTVEGAWEEWVESTIPHVDFQIRNLNRELGRAKSDKKVSLGRSLSYLTGLRQSLGILNDPEEGLRSGNWVYTEYNSTGAITFKPVHVSALAEKYVWRHATKFLLMSATIISSEVMAESLGIE